MPVVMTCSEPNCGGYLEREGESPVGPVFVCSRCGRGTLARMLMRPPECHGATPMPLNVICPLRDCGGELVYESESPVGPVYRCVMCGYGTLARRLITPPVPPLQPANPPKGRSTTPDLEGRFLALWRGHCPTLPEPKEQYRFAYPRKMAADYAWVPERVIVECDGYQHRTESRWRSDIDKLNLATRLGWKVYRVTSKMMTEDGEAFCGMVADALRQGGRE